MPRPVAFAAARWISIVGHPFVLGTLLLLSGTLRREGLLGGSESALTVLGLTVVPLGLFMAWRYRSGAWSTIDASRPRERPGMYVTALLLLGGLSILLVRRPELAYIGRGIAGLIALLLIAFFLNRWVKTSLHVASCALTGSLAATFDIPLAVFCFAGLPLLAWARVRMGRHTAREVLVGIVLGLAVGLVVMAS